MAKKQCVICGVEFDAVNNQKTCSPDCSHLLHLQRQCKKAAKWFKTPKGRKCTKRANAKAHERKRRYRQKKREQAILTATNADYALSGAEPRAGENELLVVFGFNVNGDPIEMPIGEGVGTIRKK